jgi:hypothetical protein
MAWKSPVKCRFMSSIGTICAMPPPAAPPFMPKFGPSEASRMQIMAFLPIRVEAVTKANRGRGLAFACRRRVDRRHKDQLSIGPVFLPGDEVSRNLGLVMAVGNQIFLLDAELGADLHDRFLVRRTGNLDIGLSRAALATNRNRKQASCLHETGRAMRQLRHWWPWPPDPRRQGRENDHMRRRTSPSSSSASTCQTLIPQTQCRLKNLGHRWCIAPTIRMFAPTPALRSTPAA